MKTIGILGGMSWESTAVYYRRLNELIRDRVGGLASAKILLHSFDFAQIEALQHADDWDALGATLARAASGLRAAGAEFLLIATNTMHLVADRVELESGLPVLHIADATGAAIASRGASRVALLGTRFTMEHGFYADRLAERYGIECLIPAEDDRETIHRIIYDELCIGTLADHSRSAIAAIITTLVDQGAQAVILGCTELPLLISNADASVPVLDTTELHVRAAVQRALA